MAIFDDIVVGLKAFNSNAWDIVADSIEQNKEDIIELNTKRIYDKGKDSESKPLKNRYANYKAYSPAYKKKKKRLGIPTSHVNLFLSGNYLGSWQLKANSKEVNIDVDVSNADLDAVLADLYGQNIQGLTPAEWEKVVDKFILPRIIDELIKIFA